MATPWTLQQFLNLITSEHNKRVNFQAMNSVLFQWSVDTQNLLATFPDLFDVDLAVGNQEDILGDWIGVSRNLNQTIDVPTATDNFERANGGLGPDWTVGTTGMGIVDDTAQGSAGGWASSFWTQGASDNFTRANEDPLNPAAWEVAPTITGLSPFAPLQIISDQCVATSFVEDCAEVYSGIPIGPDQLSQIKLGPMVSGGAQGLFARSSTSGFYTVDVNGPYGSSVEIDLIVATATGDTLLESWFGTVAQGDTVGLQCVGTTITVFHNGVQIISVIDATLSTGLSGIFVSPAASLTDTSIEAWTSGVAIFQNNQFSKVTITNDNPIGPAVRMTVGGNFYALVADDGVLVIYKVTGGSSDIIADAVYVPIVGDVLTLEVNGNVLTGKVNNQTLITGTDSSFTTGTPGIAALGIGGSATFWQAGSLPGVSILDDDDYRVLLKLFIAMNSWDGTVPGIYSIWATLFPDFPILVVDNQDMTMTIIFLDPPTDVVILALFTQGYFLMRPAGVRITGFYEPSGAGEPVFGFGPVSAVMQGWGTGYWLEPINV